MAYEKKEWFSGETVTASKLNRIENGIDVLSTNLDSEIESTSLLKSRVDQIVAPTGEAPNPAEITDARVGVDGTTYDSLGNAIRKQIEDVKGSITAPTISNSVSGEVVSFPDGADMIPMKSVSVNFSPVQSFNGYSKPWGPGMGKNICSPLVVGQYYDTKTGVPISADNSASTEKIAVDNLDAGITLSCTAEFRSMLFAWDQDDNFIGRTSGGVNAPSKSWVKTDFSSGSGNKEYDTIRYIALRFYTAEGTPTDINEVLSYQVMLEIGSTATAYEPYENICPISGHTSSEITRTGKNILENNITKSAIEQVTISKNADGSLTINGDVTRNGIVIPNFSFDAMGGNQNDQKKHIPNGTYAITGSNNNGLRFQIYGSNTEGTSDVQLLFFDTNGTVTIDDTYKYNWVRLHVSVGTYENVTIYPMIRLASDEDDTYEPYTGATYTNTLPSAFFGGTVDFVSGLVSSEWAEISSYSGETLPGEWLSSYDVYAPETTPTNGAQVVYKLAEPQTYHLTPQEIRTLLGQNNIFADIGNVSINYVADTKTYIDNKFEELKSLINS